MLFVNVTWLLAYFYWFATVAAAVTSRAIGQVYKRINPVPSDLQAVNRT
jgi:hypothetical protein